MNSVAVSRTFCEIRSVQGQLEDEMPNVKLFLREPSGLMTDQFTA